MAGEAASGLLGRVDLTSGLLFSARWPLRPRPSPAIVHRAAGFFRNLTSKAPWDQPQGHPPPDPWCARPGGWWRGPTQHVFGLSLRRQTARRLPVGPAPAGRTARQDRAGLEVPRTHALWLRGVLRVRSEAVAEPGNQQPWTWSPPDPGALPQTRGRRASPCAPRTSRPLSKRPQHRWTATPSCASPHTPQTLSPPAPPATLWQRFSLSLVWEPPEPGTPAPLPGSSVCSPVPGPRHPAAGSRPPAVPPSPLLPSALCPHWALGPAPPHPAVCAPRACVHSRLQGHVAFRGTHCVSSGQCEPRAVLSGHAALGRSDRTLEGVCACGQDAGHGRHPNTGGPRIPYHKYTNVGQANQLHKAPAPLRGPGKPGFEL